MNASENHSLRELREAADVGQRELSRRTGISQAKLSRAEAGSLELSTGEQRLVRLALAEPPAPAKLDSYPAAPEGEPADPDGPLNSKRTEADHNARRKWMDARNLSIQERGEPVRFDPETGNVVGHGHDCLCELCDPIGRKAALADQA